MTPPPPQTEAPPKKESAPVTASTRQTLTIIFSVLIPMAGLSLFVWNDLHTESTHQLTFVFSILIPLAGFFLFMWNDLRTSMEAQITENRQAIEKLHLELIEIKTILRTLDPAHSQKPPPPPPNPTPTP